MEIIKTEGIVIGETNYSESSKILKVLTKDYGLISIMSKGCRNLKNKLRGVSSKLVFANFQFYYKPNGISTLISADVIDTLRNIQIDIEKISYVSYIIELTEQVYKHTDDNNIYDILIATIKKINDNYDPETLTYIYELKTLDYLGIRPNIDGCSICGNTKNIITISTSDGGYICNNCYSDMYEEIEWCCECKNGWFLTKEEMASMTTGLDRTTWKCRNCRGENKSNDDGNTNGASEGSNLSISGYTEVSTGSGATDSTVVDFEGKVLERSTVADLRDRGAYYF